MRWLPCCTLACAALFTGASAIRQRIPTGDDNPGARMDERPSSRFASASWNRLVGRALSALDTALVSPDPTPYTVGVNVVSVVAAGGSLVARVAFTQCRDTPRGRQDAPDHTLPDSTDMADLHDPPGRRPTRLALP
jgi:hypothetical protein